MLAIKVLSSVPLDLLGSGVIVDKPDHPDPVLACSHEKHGILISLP
jgi:hypothetical protein